jgi:hypothetical protein
MIKTIHDIINAPVINDIIAEVLKTSNSTAREVSDKLADLIENAVGVTLSMKV